MEGEWDFDEKKADEALKNCRNWMISEYYHKIAEYRLEFNLDDDD